MNHTKIDLKASLTPVPIDRFLRPFQKFAQIQAAGGILLLLCTVVALVWANSPWAESYERLWQMPVTVGFGGFVLSKALLLWINDGLMAVFFFVVGLEIKREILVGELASLRRAALPIAAAAGGMVVPAAIYAALNSGTTGASGWGIPMATDIAFALGVLALLGNRVPVSLKIFLTALAIVDDIGAVLVIAIFYTAEISWLILVVGLAVVILAAILNTLGVRHPLVYLTLGAIVWIAFLKSGVHATVAGVLMAMTIPARSRINAAVFIQQARDMLTHFQQSGDADEDAILNEPQQAAISALEDACEFVETPLQRIEHQMHPVVSFAIMPVFALANAGVALAGDFTATFTNRVSLGIILGLIIGKQLGITLFSWLAVRLGLAALPADISWRQVYGVSWVAGIGFTMSLFIAGLAFTDAELLNISKLGILTASLIAGAVGWLLLRKLNGRQTAEKAGKW